MVGAKNFDVIEACGGGGGIGEDEYITVGVGRSMDDVGPGTIEYVTDGTSNGSGTLELDNDDS